MKKASAIITNRGGRTCHAAIIARELGIPAIVGCGDATEKLTVGQQVTVSCNEGDTGFIYDGILKFERTEQDLGELPKVGIKIMMNVGNPESAFMMNVGIRAGRAGAWHGGRSRKQAMSLRPLAKLRVWRPRASRVDG